MAAAAAGVISAAVAIGSAIASVAPTHRQCTIEVMNECANYMLCNPRMFIEDGGCTIPLSLSIRSRACGTAEFSKTPNTAYGSVGVFTYDLRHNTTKKSTEKFAVMFSVPYNYDVYKNWYAVGIFDISKPCDHDLYDEMYNDTDQAFVRGTPSRVPSITYEGEHVTIVATMSDCYLPVIKVQMKDKGTF
ncbi:uncharacterized protein LOC142992661 isoform X2 [Genypterus blacodes]